MSRKLLMLLAVVALVVAALAPFSAGAQTTDDATTLSSSNDYFVVTLTGKPAAADDSTKVNGRFDPTSRGYAQAFARMERQHARFADQLARVAPDAEIVDEYYITANAVALKLNGSSISAISRIAGVERTAQSTLYKLSLNESVDLIDAPAFWEGATGREDAGAGVKVGVIDSGIYPDHPFFDCKDIHFGGVYASGVGVQPGIPAVPALPSFGLPGGPGYSPEPGDPLYFSAAHGTHVAGIIGGCVTTVDPSDLGEEDKPWTDSSITVSGVAPGAELWDYNVFPAFGAGFVAFGGSAFSHDIAAAIEDAVADGMDVINMSLSGGVQGPHDFLAEVANEAVEADVVVVTAAGNEGPNPFTVGSPGNASEVIAVGATTNSHTLLVEIDAVESTTYWGVPGEFPSFDGDMYNVVEWTGDDIYACSLSGNEDYEGKVVVIARGNCSFSQKVANAKATGAIGAIIYNYEGQEPIPMAKTPGYDDNIPAVMVSYADGMDLVGVAATIWWPTLQSAEENLLADFSSRGPSPFTYIIKPDVVAPGQGILSSTIGIDFLSDEGLFTVSGTKWELYDGTSMASPHVAGAAAALLGEHDWTPAQVKSALVNTADNGTPGLSVFKQGGGLVDLLAADNAVVSFYPANASFGVFKGNKPANGSIDIAVSSDGCSVTGVTGNPDGYVSAEVGGATLTVSFDGGRDAPTDLYGGYVAVDCGDDGNYTIPWGAVVNR